VSRGGKALAAAVAVAAALLAAGSAQPRQSAPAGPLGLVGDGTTSSLVRLNPRNLRPLSGQRLDLGPFVGSWAYSPDRADLVLGLTSGGNTDHQASLRFVDVGTLSARGDLPLGPGYVDSTAWLAPDRIVDPVARRVLRTDPLPSGLLLSTARTAGGRLVLYANVGSRGELTIVDSDGTARSVALDRIAGFPGVAMTPDGRHAYVVAPNGLVADVDTSSLSVSYHGPFGNVENTGSYAEFLPTGQLAVAGSQEVHYVDTNRDQTRYLGTGLVLVDTSGWSAQRVDFSSAHVTVAGNTILATGSSWGGGSYYVSTGQPSPPQPPGDGVTAYTLSGTRRYQRFTNSDAFVEQVFGNRAFVYDSGSSGSGQLEVVDIRTGKLVGRRLDSTLPWILQGSSSVG
jgi:hypothetical protein